MLEAEQQIAMLCTDSGPFALQLSEEALNGFATYRSEIALANRIAIWVSSDNVLLEATLDVAGDHTLQAVIEPVTIEGRLQMLVHGLWLDNHKMPRLVRALLQEALNAALADAPTLCRFTRVAVGEGRVDIEGRID